MTMLGPLLPFFSTRWHLNDTQAGNLFFAQYVSSIGGMLSSGLLVRKYGHRITLLLGAVLMTCGVAMLAGPGLLIGFMAICTLGFGFGITTPATNLFISDAMPAKRAAALNLLNSTWGVGAMSSPLLIAAVLRGQHITGFFYLLASCLAVLALALGLFRFAADENRHVVVSPAHPRAAGKSMIVAIIGLMFFIYVGTETAVGGWVASYAQRVSPGSAALWTMMPSFFYGTVLAGRALAPLALRRLSEVKLAMLGMATALLGVMVLLASHSFGTLVAGSSLTGLGLSTVFPIQVSLLPRWFGNRVTNISGFMFALGNFGGGVIPWLVGALSTQFANLRVGFVVPLLGTASLLAFYSSQSRAFATLPSLPD